MRAKKHKQFYDFIYAHTHTNTFIGCRDKDGQCTWLTKYFEAVLIMSNDRKKWQRKKPIDSTTWLAFSIGLASKLCKFFGRIQFDAVFLLLFSSWFEFFRIFLLHIRGVFLFCFSLSLSYTHLQYLTHLPTHSLTHYGVK